jgi:hypothetical protein
LVLFREFLTKSSAQHAAETFPKNTENSETIAEVETIKALVARYESTVTGAQINSARKPLVAGQLHACPLWMSLA